MQSLYIQHIFGNFMVTLWLIFVFILLSAKISIRFQIWYIYKYIEGMNI
jgi:hypothetical protein